MNVLTSDFEVTTSNKGNPFDQTNKAVCLGLKDNNEDAWCDFTLDSPIQNYCNPDVWDLYVFFNAKFDLHWYRRVGFKLPNKIWCCQVAEFLLSGQKQRYPSLEEAAVKYGLGHKIDLIKEEFWERNCSCHVSIAKRLETMLNSYANLATINDITKQDLLELLKSEHGEWLIQSSKDLLNSAELRSYEQILTQRLEHIEQKNAGNTDSQILSMIISWLKQTALFVENLNLPYASITITQQEELEICYVEHVMHLWDILNDQTGWREHTHTCSNIKIDTDAIPQDILSTYCCQDVSLTYQIYLKQLEQFKAQPKLYKLFKLMCQDLLVLEEMEWNGLVYDKPLCEERSINIGKEIAAIQEQLHHVYPELAINFGSGDQLSAWLYGGSIYSEDKEHIGFFKSGAKVGQPKFKNVIRETVLPRLVEPLKNSELKKEGYYATDEATLQKLKGPAAKKYVGPLLKLAELQKLDSTYYKGLPKKAKEMNWPEGKIHGQFNQVVAQTGRLSSSQPNLQNFSGDCLDIFITRFD